MRPVRRGRLRGCCAGNWRKSLDYALEALKLDPSNVKVGALPWLL
jgi:hypothetical protein